MTSCVFRLRCVFFAFAVAFAVRGSASAEDEPPRIKLHLITGRTIVGRLTSIDSSGSIEYRSDTSAERVPIEDVDTIAPVSHDPEESTDRDAARPNKHVCTFFLADGGELTGGFVGASARRGQSRTVRVEARLGRPIEIPFDRLVAMRMSAEPIPSLEPEFQARRSAAEAGHDLLMMALAGKPVVLAGALENLTPDKWEFAIGDQVRSAALERAYGIILGASPIKTEPLPALIRLVGGNRFTARVVSADPTTLVVDAGPLGRFELPWRSIDRIELQSGRIAYLSDLEPADLVVRSIIGGEWPPQRNRNVTGGPITLSRRTYERGMGVHAYTSLAYDLNAGFERFMADVGIDDSMGLHGNAIFRVRGDGRLLFKSPPMTGGSTPVSVSVDVKGIKSLMLECDFGEGLDLSDHGDWADARLIRSVPDRTGGN